MILLTRTGCPHCRKFAKVVQRFINYKLPPGERIRIENCNLFEKYGIQLSSRAEGMQTVMEANYPSHEQGYPFCFLVLDEENLQGVLVDPAPPQILRTYLNSLLELN